jgi:hypothetical protein
MYRVRQAQFDFLKSCVVKSRGRGSVFETHLARLGRCDGSRHYTGARAIIMGVLSSHNHINIRILLIQGKSKPMRSYQERTQHILAYRPIARQRSRNKQRDNGHFLGNGYVSTQQYSKPLLGEIHGPKWKYSSKRGPLRDSITGRTGFVWVRESVRGLLWFIPCDLLLLETGGWRRRIIRGARVREMFTFGSCYTAADWEDSTVCSRELLYVWMGEDVFKDL